MKRSLVLLALLNTALACTTHAASRLTNVSVRSTAGSGSDTLIVGFSIAGTGSKSMLVRGVGPTLAAFNVTNPVADPQLRLFNQANTAIVTNDNWGGDPALANLATSVGAFALPANSRDAAFVATLAPGSYSAHLESNTNNGIALVEAYDADTATASAHIRNVSARSTAGTGAAVLTIGFSISGDVPKTVLIRAVGPSLVPLGVDGALANPQLRLFSPTRAVIGLNDDWPSAAGWSAAFTAAGAFQLTTNTRDAVLLVNLPPGTYTAQASGVNNTSGVALIEVYDVANPPAASYVLRPVENTDPFPPVDLPRGGSVPAVLTQARPQYPFELRRAGISGEALIDFVVNSEGRVQNAFALRATDVLFAESALAAVRQWTFRPGLLNGQPINTHMQVPIVFTLNEL